MVVVYRMNRILEDSDDDSNLSDDLMKLRISLDTGVSALSTEISVYLENGSREALTLLT